MRATPPVNGNKIQLYACNGTAAQTWSYTGGTFVGPGGKCLGIHGGQQTAGTLVDLYQCNGTSGQQWSVGGKTIKSTAGLCLDVQGAVSSNGTPVQVSSCNGTTAQQWTVKNAPPPPPPTDAGKTDSGGGGGGSGAPSAVTNLQETGQGAHSTSLSWGAATAGKAAIAHYKIYRNGAALATTTATTYTDETATGATAEGYSPDHPATTYTYNVSAVDAEGDEGPEAPQLTAWMYNDGTAFWGGQDYDAPDIKANYGDTSGRPEDGAWDISITVSGSAKWWQPYSGAPFLSTDPPVWAMEIGAFHYMTIDLKPTRANQTWQINVISRNPPGDTFNSAAVVLPGKFGPAAEVGKWATYKIPFLPSSGFADGSSLEVGYGKLTGSISGSTLTVTGDVSGLNVQASSWLSGPGIAANTWITGPAAASGGPGTYQVSPSQHVARTTINEQRTNMYKFSLIDLTSYDANVYYVDKVGFTTN